MVPSEKMPHALKALQDVLVLARFMAYEKESHNDIAFVLDVAEHLPALLLDDKEDRTVAFRGQLALLAGKWPMFTMALESFDVADSSSVL